MRPGVQNILSMLFTDYPNEYDLREYWAQIETDFSYTVTKAYRSVHPALDRHDNSYLFRLSTLLASTENLNEAFLLRAYLIEHYRGIGIRRTCRDSLGIKRIPFIPEETWVEP
jgi:hypothetical protein